MDGAPSSGDWMQRWYPHAPDVMAGYATESGWVGPVGLADRSATITFSQGVSRNPLLDPHSFERRFVFAEGPQFEKGPTMQNRTMLNLYPASAPVFERDSSSGALGVSNDPLRNRVIHVAGKARFFTRKPSPSAASRLAWFLGQPRRKPPVAMANAFHSGAAVVFSLRVAGDLSDSEVTPRNSPASAGTGASTWQVAVRNQFPPSKTRSASPGLEASQGNCRPPAANAILVLPASVPSETVF
jgi:hypothetical protein